MAKKEQKIEYELEDCIPTIDAILKVSNLEKISVKSIRKAIESLFDTSFVENKREINEIIMNRYYKISESKSNNEDTEGNNRSMIQQLEDLKKENQLLSIRLNSSLSIKTIAKTKRKNKDKLVKKQKGTALLKSWNVDQTLAEFLGSNEPITRQQTVKRIWEHIKLHDLQDPTDRRQINCDERMKPMFGDKVDMFTMNKLLSQHFVAMEQPEQVEDGDGDDIVNDDIINEEDDDENEE